MSANDVTADSSSRSQAHAYDAWNSFNGLCEAFMRLFGLISQLAFISQQKSAGTLFTLVALVRPMMTLVNERTLWLKRESYRIPVLVIAHERRTVPQHTSRTRKTQRISDFSPSNLCLSRSSGETSSREISRVGSPQVRAFPHRDCDGLSISDTRHYRIPPGARCTRQRCSPERMVAVWHRAFAYKPNPRRMGRLPADRELSVPSLAFY